MTMVAGGFTAIPMNADRRKTMIKSVIFDLDNTLYDYDRSHVYGMKALSDYCGKNFHMSQEETEQCYRKANRIVIDRIGTDTASIHNRLIRTQCMLELIDRPLFPYALEMYHAYWDESIRQTMPSPGVLDFLKELKKRNIRTGIGTDMTAYIQYKRIEHIGAAPYIDFVVTSEEAGVEKPHYHLFELCAQKAGVRPEECIFIGDNVKKDIEGAWESGMKGIWYTQEKDPPEHRYFPVLRSFRNIDIDQFLE